MQIWPDSFAVKPAIGNKAKWSYDQGVILKGIEALWYATGDPQYYQYILHSMDYYVKEDGSVYDYKPDEFNIDHLNNGKMLLTLFQVTGKEKYKKALDQMYGQWKQQPRNEFGGLWHKKIYPNQMWLDGLYMGAAFYAQYASVFHDTAAYNEITRQFVLAEEHTRDAQTGLLVHAWDAAKIQKWADPKTGKSPHVWGRAMGWYGVALVDALDYYPVNHPGRDTLIQILNRYAAAIVKVQNSNGLWYDIIDAPNDPRNYYEASASSMMAITLFKAVKNGYIASSYLQNAKKAYAGLVANCVKYNNGDFELHNTVSVSGLGGNPYRDGTLDYYFKEPIVVNDPKGMGAFLQCAVLARAFEKTNFKTHKVVTLDAFYNNELKKDAKGNDYRWHYSWEEVGNSGNACLGSQFVDQGANLRTLTTAPTVAALKNTNVYMIVDADHVRDNPNPNYMNAKDADVIASWVQQGGTLLVMANDSFNTDLVHMNILLEKFGVSATNQSVNMVKGNAFEMGNVFATKGNGVFSESIKMHLKEVSALDVKAPATVVATNGTVPVIAKAAYGKGKVLIVGDPWLYNEYLDGRKLPKQYQNFQAAQELVNWLLKD
jgi:unsaturated rhamnogalacturonyl hydrolase